MKKIKLLCLSLLLLSFNTVFAGEIDYFQVELGSDSAKIGEALDLTITAMDRDDNIVDDYIGTILVFSETDPKAELPTVLNEGSYTYSLSDSGIVKFENAVVFNSDGLQDLHVYDLNDETDSVAGIVEVEITKGSEEARIEEISITSPETASTLTSSSIQVAGKTASNHRVVVTSNGSDFETISNSDGIYELTITNQKDGDVELQARVLDADDNEIGKSNTVNIKLSASAPSILGVEASPKQGIPEYTFSVEVVSEPGLEKVELTINDSISELTETDGGVYVGDFVAPTEIGEYSITVMLQNNLGVKSNNPNITYIKVVEPELNSPVEPEPDREEFHSKPPIKEEEVPNLDITGMKLTKLKTKSVLEWDTVTEANFYDVYIKEGEELLFVEKVTDPRVTVYITGDEIQYSDFVVRAIKENFKDDADLVGDLSEAVKIQTGPEKYLLLILIALFMTFVIRMGKFTLKK